VTDLEILDRILRHEGGYVNDPTDRGGCTNFGITRQTLSDWRKGHVTCDDVRDMTEAEAREIYAERYLTPFSGVDRAVKAQIVDIAVNAGVRRAVALLELAEHGPKPLNTQLAIERLKHYVRIVKDNPTQIRFLAGWVNRACEYL
jgi:lysozyme family protein